MMMQYVGICMVIVVTGLVLALTAGAGTRNVLKAIEEHRERAMAKKSEQFAKNAGIICDGLIKAFGEIDEMVQKRSKKQIDDILKEIRKKPETAENEAEDIPPIKE